MQTTYIHWLTEGNYGTITSEMKSLLLFWGEKAHPHPLLPQKVNFSREKEMEMKKQSKNTQTFSDPLKQQEN